VLQLPHERLAEVGAARVSLVPQLKVVTLPTLPMPMSVKYVVQVAGRAVFVGAVAVAVHGEHVYINLLN